MSPKTKKTIEEKDLKVDPTKSLDAKESFDLVSKNYLSEKAASAQSLNKYTFKVPLSASRVDVRLMVERKYGVKVTSVNVVRLPIKVKKFAKVRYARPLTKKIIVTLRSGDKIDIIPQ